MKSAQRIRALLHSDTYPSGIWQSHSNCRHVQDAYTLRCAPQVHGIVWDTISFVRGIIATEINSATDNPMIFGTSIYLSLSLSLVLSCSLLLLLILTTTQM
jgi:histidine ammonia-lyase